MVIENIVRLVVNKGVCKRIAGVTRRTSRTNNHNGSTIFALSSGKGKSALAVIRITGPSANISLTEMTKLPTTVQHAPPKPRKLYVTKIRHPVTKELLDKGMAVWLPGPTTYTGEDSVELYVHGGDSVIRGILEGLAEISGYRLAEPGEFTRRAFLNGKMDLSEAEGIADLLNAETKAQKKLALRQSSGSLRLLYAEWRERILRATAHLEAFIDFSEDENLEPDLFHSVKSEIERLKSDLNKHLEKSRAGERVRCGIQICIIGRPNVGKSTLLNLLCGDSERAIVTPIAGTTRDSLDVHMDLGGYPITLVDTAGLRNSTDPIEEEGVRRAMKKLKESDVVVLMTEVSYSSSRDKSLENHVNDLLREFCGTDKNPEEISRLVVVVNKMDLNRPKVGDQLPLEINVGGKMCAVVPISCLKMTGYDELLQTLEREAQELCMDSFESPVLTQVRHKNAIIKALEHIEGFFRFVDSDSVIAARKLRNTLHELGKITGAVSTEDILDTIFRDFCIGK